MDLNNCHLSGLGSVFFCFSPFPKSMLPMLPPKAVTDPPRKESPPSIVMYENIVQSLLFWSLHVKKNRTRKTHKQISYSDSWKTHLGLNRNEGSCSGNVTKKGSFGIVSTLPILSNYQARLACARCRTAHCCYFKFSHLFCIVFVATASMYCYCKETKSFINKSADRKICHYHLTKMDDGLARCSCCSLRESKSMMMA